MSTCTTSHVLRARPIDLLRDTAKGFGSVTLWQKVLFFFFQEVNRKVET